MVEILTTITEHVRGVVERRRREIPVARLRDRPPFGAARRGFARSLSGGGRRIIAEIKKASPSKGLMRPDFDPLAAARSYVSGGASAISVLTEERFFHGSLEHLEAIRGAVDLPLLRKDFTLDAYQLFEARAFGADAVLFIAAMLDRRVLRELCEQAAELGLDCLVEVHTETELAAAVDAGAHLLGINNRDLKTFAVDLATTERLAPLVPAGMPAVCESGIDSPEQIRRVERCGIQIFLIGEALMRAPDPAAKLRELLA